MPTAPHRATQALRDFVKVSREFEAHVGQQLAVNPTDLAAMEHLMESGPLAPTELARRLRLSPPAVTAAVDRLEALGHVTRESNPSDRRGVVITPASASVASAMRMLAPMIADVDAALDELDPEDQELIADYLDRVLAAYRNHLPA